MSAVRRLWRLLDVGQRLGFVALQGLCIAMAFSTLIGLAAIVPFFSVLAEPQEIFRQSVLARLYELGGFRNADAFVTALGAAFITLITAANAVNMIGTALLNRFAFAVGDSLRVELFRRYLAQGINRRATENSAALLNNLIYEVDRVTGWLQGLFSLTANGVAVVFIIVTAALIDVHVTVVAAVLLGSVYLFLYASTRRRLIENGAVQTRFAAERATVAAEALAALKELTIWGVQQKFLDRFATACKGVTQAASSTQNIAQQPRYALESLAVAGLVTIALVLRANGASVGAWLSELTFLGFAAYRLLPAVQQVFHSAVRLRATLSAFERIEGSLADAGNLEHGTSCTKQAQFARAIAVVDVSFSYGSDRPPALSEVSLEIPHGATVGIIGANGSGKTTLLDLLLGLLTPSRGHIAIDGRKLGPSTYGSWQAQVAYVPQRIALLDATLADNIAFTLSAGPIDSERMSAAVRAAGLDELLTRLPNGLKERIGAHGVQLSGGERQRLGIARALYRDSAVLVLDEATSALDQRGEDHVVRTLQDLRGRKTVIVVAHRLATVRACDVIFELENGRIVRRGTPDQLRTTSALFRRGSIVDQTLN